MNYLQFEFNIKSAVENELLIALLTNAGFESFEEEEGLLKAFIKEDEYAESELSDILKIVPVEYNKNIIQQQNWNAQWESSFEPVVVNDFAAIRADFHEPIPGVEHEIIITPKMSFGTGHHATTHMMIEQMSGLYFKDKAALDFGTGTGVLAILAEKMGASAVEAIDNDDWSIENAKENINANHCSKIYVHKAETIPSGKKYDVILANINLHVILQSLPAIASASETGTLVLLSGFLEKDVDGLSKELYDHRFIVTGKKQKGEWVCLRCQKD
jgi:ribosomal protein L11 methyltransferase